MLRIKPPRFPMGLTGDGPLFFFFLTVGRQRTVEAVKPVSLPIKHGLTPPMFACLAVFFFFPQFSNFFVGSKGRGGGG